MWKHAAFRVTVLLVITIFLFPNLSFSAPENRLALLIGNSNYKHGGSLDNPVNDVRAIKKALEGLGFTVMKYEDCSQKTMKRAMDKFGRKLKGKNVGLFFYAGHGVQVNGHNYLMPVNAKLDTEHDAEYDCVRADRVLAKMEGAGSRTNIVILDACRDNPFERSWRRGTEGSGLAFMNAPSGSLIAYATAPGKTALDGRGKNSPYTSALLQHIGTPNITVLEMFQGVRSTVMEKSGYKQTPWESTSLRGNFYFTTINHAAPGQTDGIRDYDKIIEERNANRKKWDSWQNNMETALAKVEQYDKSNALNEKEKAEAWEGLLASYGADNPYTAKDDEFRKKAGERNRYWKGYKESGKLFVDTAPTGAKIRILNIGPKFYQGMELKPGRYQVEASKRGFQTKKMWVRLEPGENKKLDIGLEQLQASTPSYLVEQSSNTRPTIEKKQKEHQRQKFQIDSVPQKSSHPQPSLPSNGLVKRDGQYVAYADGIVRDMKTGLEWKAGPDRDTNWNEARSWVQNLNLDEGGWRMPTMDELEGLYKDGKGDLTPMLKTTGWQVWSAKTEGSRYAWYFSFNLSKSTWEFRNLSDGKRAFAVRSRGDG